MQYNLIKLGTLMVAALLFCSCDGLLPKKIDDSELDDDEFYDGLEDIEETIIEDDCPPPYDDDYSDNDVSMLYAEHDLGQMSVSSFYSEKYCGNGNSNPERFLSKKLKRALKGISDLESMTGFIILESDPFIDAQDVVGSLRKGKFNVERNGSSDWFTFSYDNVKVKLKVIEEQGDYYIDDVKLPSGKTLTELYEDEKRNAY